MRISGNRHPNITKHEHDYAIFCRPEVAGDVNSGENVKTVERYVALNFEAASFRMGLACSAEGWLWHLIEILTPHSHSTFMHQICIRCAVQAQYTFVADPQTERRLSGDISRNVLSYSVLP